MYNIIMCYSCGRLLIAKSTQRTRQCPHCESRINPERAKLVASAKTAMEASELIRTLKQKREPEKAEREMRLVEDK